MKRRVGRIICLWMLLLAMLCAPASAAIPAGGEIVRVDLDGDGMQENLHIYKINSSDEYGNPAYQIRMSLYDSTQSLVDDVLMVEYNRETEDYMGMQTEIFALSGGRIYMEHRICLEGVSTLYKVWNSQGNRLGESLAIEDPGYSSAIGLRDPYTGRDIFLSEDYDDYAGMLAALNRNFASEGLSFGQKEISFTMPEGYKWMMNCFGASLDNINRLCELDCRRLTADSSKAASAQIEGFFLTVDGESADGSTAMLSDGEYTIAWGAQSGAASYHLYLYDGSGSLINSAENIHETSLSLSTSGMRADEIYTVTVGAVPVGGGAQDVQWKELRLQYAPAQEQTQTAAPAQAEALEITVSGAQLKGGVYFMISGNCTIYWDPHRNYDSYNVYLYDSDNRLINEAENISNRTLEMFSNGMKRGEIYTLRIEARSSENASGGEWKQIRLSH